MNNSMREHWNDVYSSKDVNQLGWYEKTPTPCLELLSKCNATKDMTILDVGTGASPFMIAIEEGRSTFPSLLELEIKPLFSYICLYLVWIVGEPLLKLDLSTISL